jgi:hypothetical protein
MSILKCLSAIALVLLSTAGYGQSDWRRIHVVNHSEVEGVAEASSGTLLAQDRKTLFRSMDGVERWIEAHPGFVNPQADMYGRFFCSSSSGGMISRDDGRTFQRLPQWPFSPGNSTLTAHSGGSLFVSEDGVLWRSRDFGATWDTLLTQVYYKLRIGRNGVMAILRTRPRSGDSISVTTNGGQTWLTFSIPNYGTLAGYGFTARGNLIVDGAFFTLRSNKFWNGWDTLPGNFRKISAIASDDKGTDYAIMNDSLWTSHDNGETWIPIRYVYNKALWETRTSVWTRTSALCRLEDGELIPRNLGFPDGLYVKKAWVYNNDTLIANQPFGVLHGTRAAGNQIPPESPQGLGYASDFHVFRDTLYNSGNDCMRSTDGGTTWVNTPFRWLVGIDSVGKKLTSYGWSGDGGINLYPYVTPVSTTHVGMRVIEGGDWLFAGKDSLARSSDGGIHWTLIDHPVVAGNSVSLEELKKDCWLVYGDSSMAITFDAGNNWKLFDRTTYGFLGRATTDGHNNHVIMGTGSSLKQWDPNKQDWITFDSCTFTKITSVDFAAPNTLFIGTLWDGLWVRDYPAPIERLNVNRETSGDNIIRDRLNGTRLIKSITPNPAKDEIRVELNVAGSAEITVFNALGVEVVKTGLYKIDVFGLAGGVYYVRVANGGSVETRRIVVEH